MLRAGEREAREFTPAMSMEFEIVRERARMAPRPRAG